jgi:hypothetical protein
LIKNVPLRKIVCHEKKAEIEEAVRELSGFEPGTKGYMACYSRGLEQVMRGLGRAELARMEQLKLNWRDEGYPEDVQKR